MSNNVHYTFTSIESNPNDFVEYPGSQMNNTIQIVRPVLSHHINGNPPPVDPVLLNNTVHFIRYATPEMPVDPGMVMNHKHFVNHINENVPSPGDSGINQVHYVKPLVTDKFANIHQRNEGSSSSEGSRKESLSENNIHFLPPEKVGPTVPCKFADVGCCAMGTPMEIELHCMQSVVLHQNLAYTGFTNLTHQLEELQIENAAILQKSENVSMKTEQKEIRIENLERKYSEYKNEIKWLNAQLQKKTDQHELTLRELRSVKKRVRDKATQTDLPMRTVYNTSVNITNQRKTSVEEENWDLDEDVQRNVKTADVTVPCESCAILQKKIGSLEHDKRNFQTTVKAKDNELAQLRQNYKAYKLECKRLSRQLTNQGVNVPTFIPADAPTDSIDSSELEEEYERLLVQYQHERDIYEKISDELFQTQNQLKQLNLHFVAANIGDITVNEPIQNAVSFQISNAAKRCNESQYSKKPYTLISAECYSGKPGYKYQYRISLQGYHLGFDFRIRNGAYDAFLKWPFEMGIHLTIFSDNPSVQNKLTSIKNSEILLASRRKPTVDVVPPTFKYANMIDIKDYISSTNELKLELALD